MIFDSIGKLVSLVAVMGLTGISPVLAEEDETPLAEQMEDVSGALKGLRKADGFAAKAELARKGQAACIKALQFLPVMFEGIKDEKEKTRVTADYRRMMGMMLSGLAELELAFLAEDEDKADEVVDKLKDLKKEAHNAYVEDE